MMWRHEPPSQDIEMTAYVLMTYLVRGDVAGGLPAAKWLLQQRNSLGGYGSTQDTCVALEALAAFADATFSDMGEMVVRLTSSADADWDATMTFNRANFGVLQTTEVCACVFVGAAVLPVLTCGVFVVGAPGRHCACGGNGQRHGGCAGRHALEHPRGPGRGSSDYRACELGKGCGPAQDIG